MGAIDIILLVIFGIALFYGAYRGVVRQISSLCGVIFGIMAGKIYAQGLGCWLVTHTGLPSYLFPVASFILIFLGVVLLCGLIGKMMQRLVSAAGVGSVNRILGALVSFFKWLLIVSMVINLMEFFSLTDTPTMQREKVRSHLYRPVRKVVPTLFPKIPIVIENATEIFK